jgi:hypothetical protein
VRVNCHESEALKTHAAALTPKSNMRGIASPYKLHPTRGIKAQAIKKNVPVSPLRMIDRPTRTGLSILTRGIKPRISTVAAA